MWCDNCLLLLPLRTGSMAWAVWIILYSVAGSVFLFMEGKYFFFYSSISEPSIYGGIGMGIAAVALINLFALGNRSYIWSRACKFLWPFIIIIALIRAIIMIVELERNHHAITWECDNGGQLWNATADATAPATSSGATLPTAFCATGFSSLNIAFICGLVVDIVCQMYMYFLNWRFTVRLEHYSAMSGPYGGGYYKS